MDWNWKTQRKEKHQFKSYYCAGCKQAKPCGTLTDWNSEWKNYCCLCYYQNEQQRTEEYSNYQQVYQRKEQEKKEKFQQLQLLKSHQGCPRCGSLAVDAYSLYEKSRLICQPCRMKKEGGSSGPIRFLERNKWYKRYWGIDLKEWLEKFQCLPVNKNCAERCKPSAKQKWLKDRNHLNNCDCLEQEAKEIFELFTSSSQRCQKKLKDCQCVKSEKIRVDSDYYTWCERCQEPISAASKKRVIKNRNDPKFWGLNVKERMLCGNCLESKKENMPSLRRAEFNRYRKVKRL